MSDVTVTPSRSVPGATLTYTVAFTPATPLGAGDEVVVDFSHVPGTALSADAADYQLTDAGTGAVVDVSASPDSSGASVNLTLGSAPGADRLQLAAANVTNPRAVVQDAEVLVSTSWDSAGQGSYAIRGGTLTASPASAAPAQKVALTFSFTAETSIAGTFVLEPPTGWEPANVTRTAKLAAGGQLTDLTYRGRTPAIGGRGTFTLAVVGAHIRSMVGGNTVIPIATFDVEVGLANVSPDPTDVAAGDPVRITAANVPATCSSVNFFVGSSSTPESVTAGQASHTVTAPATPGAIQVTVTCNDPGQTYLGKTRFVVEQPTVTSTDTTTTKTTTNPPPAVSLAAAPANGLPGAAFAVKAVHVPSSCATPTVYLGAARLGRPELRAGGFRVTVHVPRKARPARTMVTLRCGGGTVVAGRRFVVGRRPPPPPARLALAPRSGPRGSVFAATATRVPCPRADLYLGQVRVGSARVSLGELSDSRLTVPSGSSIATKDVTVRCGGTVVTTAAFDVTGRADHRLAFVAAAPSGSRILRHRGTLAAAALVALLMLFLVALIGFPADWFNDTYTENRERLRGAVYRVVGRRPPAHSKRPSRVGLVAFLVVAGVLTCAATDWPRLDRAYLWALLGTTIGVAALTVGFQLPSILSARVVHAPGRLQVLVGSVAVAAVCVAATRLLRLDPPYLYGLIAVFVVERESRGPGGARLTALGALVTLVLSVGAWLADLRIEPVAAGASPSPGALVLEAALVTVFLAGLGSIVFALVPLPFLPGREIWAWNRLAWLGLFAAGAYAFAVIMLTPRNGYTATVRWDDVVPALVAFAVFAAVSVSFMAYFRFVRPPADKPVEAWPSRGLN